MQEPLSAKRINAPILNRSASAPSALTPSATSSVTPALPQSASPVQARSEHDIRTLALTAESAALQQEAMPEEVGQRKVTPAARQEEQESGFATSQTSMSLLPKKISASTFTVESPSREDPIQLLPKPEETPFMTHEELEEELNKATLTEIYQFFLALQKIHQGQNPKPAHLQIVENYLTTEFKRIIKIVQEFEGNAGYTSKHKPFIHNLFGDVTMTLYPLQGRSPDEKREGSARQKVHRPVLDIEIVGRVPYARCYIGLYGPAGSTGFKDVTSDDKGVITLKDIGLMNLGNPFKALLWAEDYLNSKEHYQNADSSKQAPKPVVRSFLVPLADAQGMIMRYEKYSDVRPLDQDRGSGQFGHISNERLYSEILSPVIGSLVSFFHDPEDFEQASNKGQRKFGLTDLQEFLTGHREDVRKITSKGIAAQHDRFGHKAEFNPNYQHVMEAYYKSVDTSETGYTAGTNGTAPEQRKSRIVDVLDRFPRVSNLLSEMGKSDLGSSKDAFPSSEKQSPSLARLSAFLEAYASLDVIQDENNDMDESASRTEVPNSFPSGPTGVKEKQAEMTGVKEKQESQSSSKAEKSNPKNQYSRVDGVNEPVIARAWFQVIQNPGGGDCLFHALEGHTLNGPEILKMRADVAGVREHQADTDHGQAYNANVVAATITQTPSLTSFAPMVLGRQAVPNRVLALMQSIPGVYAGQEELIQWASLRKKSVIVIDQDGTVTRYSEGGIQPLFNLQTERSARNLNNIRTIAVNAKLVLYKSPGHWEKINGVSSDFPNL